MGNETSYWFNNVLLVKGLKQRYFDEIPLRYWVVEFCYLMITLYAGIAIVIIKERNIIYKNKLESLKGIAALFILTLIFPAGPSFMKYMASDDRESSTMFYVRSACMKKWLAMIAPLSGGEVEDTTADIAERQIRLYSLWRQS